MARRKSRSAVQSLSAIDVTPLVDLTFILLIVFMVTASASKSLIKMPEMGEAKEIPKKTRVISLDEKGQISYNEQPLTVEELKKVLSMEDQSTGDYAIQADKRLTYGQVIDLMKTIKTAGITNIALVTLSSE